MMWVRLFEMPSVSPPQVEQNKFFVFFIGNVIKAYEGIFCNAKCITATGLMAALKMHLTPEKRALQSPRGG